MARNGLSAVAQRARSEATKQLILLFTRRDGLLRGPCHRARFAPARWLAMTVSCRDHQNGLLKNFEPFSPYRQGSSTAFVMPIRSPAPNSPFLPRACIAIAQALNA